jgi:cation:H+ antiporter
MLPALGLLVGGAILVYLGAEAAIRGAAGLARALRIPMFALGALLFGIDLEGLGTAVVASARDQASIAAGEIFGTIMFLYSAAFGVALLVAREPVRSPPAAMVIAPAGAVVIAGFSIADLYVERLEGGLLLLLFAAYVALVVQQGRLARARADRMEREAEEAPRSRMAMAAFAVGGLALLTGGAFVLVEGGTRFFEATALSAGFVGAAVIGVLVSLDEVLLEVLPVRRGTPDLATGNLFGTVAAFCTGVLGIAALVRPLAIDSGAALAFLGAAALYAIVATVFLARGRTWRGLGVTVLAVYAVWLLVGGST